jgi:deoxyribose-phosphate aldolase
MQSSSAALARQALACLDLTSLNDGDDEASVQALCRRAQGPFGTVAAVCVWPGLATAARRWADTRVAVAAVANFPAGRTDIPAALRDVAQIVEAGAQEVDLVLPWRVLRSGDHRSCSELVGAVRKACAGLKLKLIIESGELADAALIAQACRIGIDAGVDFLKTSTGKTPIGATPAAARVMLRSIATDRSAAQRLGFKVSGGVRTMADAAPYMALVREILGDEALQPQRFRIGASALLSDIEAILGRGPAAPVAEGY